jgi:hypothetical protein
VGWYGHNAGQDSGPVSLPQIQEIGRSERKSAWACPACGGRMSVIAVIRPSGVCRVVLIVVPAFGGLRHSRSHVRADSYSSTVQTVYINTPFALGNSEVTYTLWDEVSGWGLNQPENRWYIGLAPYAGQPGTPSSDDYTRPARTPKASSNP